MAANGQIPLEQLTAVPGGHLRADVAIAWLSMVDACRRATGVTLTISQPDGAYRTLAEQWEAWSRYQAGTGASAAYPGYSPHGLGEAVDVWNWAAAGGWLSEHADEYGFVRDVAGEPWHFHKIGALVAAAIALPTAAQREDENMFAIIWGAKSGAGLAYLLNKETGLRRYIKPVEVSIYGLSGTPTVGGISQPEFDAIAKEPGTVDHDGSIVPVR